MAEDESFHVVNNKEALRFEVNLNGELAYIKYQYYKKDIAFMHTVVPDAFRGKGIGAAMAVAALQFVQEQHRKIMLYCTFMAKYVREHPEYHALVDTNFHPSFGRVGQNGS